jgi:hypothetical protein
MNCLSYKVGDYLVDFGIYSCSNCLFRKERIRQWVGRSYLEWESCACGGIKKAGDFACSNVYSPYQEDPWYFKCLYEDKV